MKSTLMKCVLFAFYSSVILTKIVSFVGPSECSRDAILYDTCYEIFDDILKFNDAEEMCLSKNGTLAIVKSAEVNQKIAFLANKKDHCKFQYERLWIGLNDKSTEQEYVYSDGTKMNTTDYQPWAKGQPSDLFRKETDPYEDCISLSSNSLKWYDDQCSDEKKFVCQYKSRATCNIQRISIKNAEFPDCNTNSIVSHGFEVLIKCREGFILAGPSTVKCMPSGIWSDLPQCVEGCSQPPLFQLNSYLVDKKNYYFLGEKATFICNDGYFSSRNHEKSHFTITCTSFNKWIPERSGCAASKKFQIVGMEITADDVITLNCKIEETPKSTNDSKKNQIEKRNLSYVWLKDSIEYPLAENDKLNHDLILYENSTENISGLYMCFLKGESIIPGTVVYDVKRRKMRQCNDDLNEETVHYTYKEGVSALLYCPHNYSYIGFHWFKDDEFFPLNDDHVLYPDGSLYIQRIEFSHQGTYTCMMTIKDTFCSKNITVEVAVIASAESICGNVNRSRDHPWTVSLWWKDEVAPFCYGSLIRESWVITTAHCLSGLYRKRKINVFVRFGRNLTKDIGSDETNNENFFDIPIKMVKIHPLYSKKMSVNDIGLVKLEHPVKFTNNIQPICFTETDLTISNQCFQSPPINGLVSGWSSLERDNADEIFLAEESMTFVPEELCLSSKSYYIDRVLCFKQTFGTHFSLAGDSGSPLEVFWKNRVYLLGIYSWGERIAGLGEYDYFTKVSTFVSWVSSCIEED